MTKGELKAKHKQEAVQHVLNFYQTSWQWRSQAYHHKWDKWERNYRNIYDPTILAKKEPWQSAMFIPATVTNVEVIKAAVVKLLLGRERPIGFKRRESGDELQAELHGALLDHQIDRSEFPICFYDVVTEALVFGNGFMKFYWEQIHDKRRLKVPIRSGLVDLVTTGLMPGSVKGEKDEVRDVLVKDQVTVKRVHIRDIFLEPNSLDMTRVLERDKNITYGELKDFADKGYFDKDSVEQMWDYYETDNFEIDVQPLKYAQEITDPKVPRPHFDKKHTVFEFWAPIPRKWIELELADDKPSSEEMVPGKIMVGSGRFFLASGENESQSLTAPYLKMGYLRSGQTYDIGVAQLMEGLQDEYNEVRNLRIDNVAYAMNKMFIAIKNKLVDPDNIVSKPGGVIFAKGSDLSDVRNAIQELQVSDVAISAFRETGELERQIQEVTGANRMTTGTAGLVKDANQTLGGMELLKQAAADRFAINAFIMAKQFLIPAAKRYMELVYLHMPPEQIHRILGDMPVEYLPDQWMARWQLFKKMPPNDLFMDYDIVPFDVFSEENKMAKAQMLLGYGQFLATILPGWNPKPLAKKVGIQNGLTADEVTEILGQNQEPIPTPMMMGQGMPSVSKTQTGPVSTAPSPKAAPTAVPTGAGLGNGMG